MSTTSILAMRSSTRARAAVIPDTRQQVADHTLTAGNAALVNDREQVELPSRVGASVREMLPKKARLPVLRDQHPAYGHDYRRPYVEEFADRLVAAGIDAAVTRSTDLRIGDDGIHVPSAVLLTASHRDSWFDAMVMDQL